MPPDTNHPALLTDFVEGLIPLLELCNIHALDPQQLAAWATSDQTQRDLAALAHLAQLRAAAIAAQAHPTALARLATIALSPTPTDPNADTTGPRAAALAAQAASPKALSLRARLTETTRKAATSLAAQPRQESRERTLAPTPTNPDDSPVKRTAPSIEGPGPSIENAGRSIDGAGRSIEGAGLSSPARTRPPLHSNQQAPAVTNHAPPERHNARAAPQHAPHPIPHRITAGTSRSVRSPVNSALLAPAANASNAPSPRST